MRINRLFGEADIIVARGICFNKHFSNEANLSCRLRLAYPFRSIIFTMI